MDYQKKLSSQIFTSVFIAVLLPLVISSATAYLLLVFLKVSPLVAGGAGLLLGIILGLPVASMTRKKIRQPVDVLAQAIAYAAHNDSNTTAPNTDKTMLGRELITGLTLQVYNLASSSHVADDIVSNAVGQKTENSTQPRSEDIASAILNNTPTPLVGISSELTIQNANSAFSKFIGLPEDQIIGRNFNEIMQLSFPGEETLESWIKTMLNNSVVATKSWDRVRLLQSGEVSKQFDMVAGYSSGNSTGTDLIISFFDRTELYNQDDREVSFVALAVHELRTPLTVMRGYIEVFEDEVGPKLNAEMQDFLKKMQASAQQLTAFVGNILNVARIEEDQLTLKLRKEDITSILQSALSDLRLRAQVHGKTIELLNGDNLPAIGADRISIHEVINNLIDNAIKYSGDSQKISVKSFVNDDGFVQIDVQDYGIGIPASVMPNLFQKYHRSHKSKVQVGGTGLGLYLCKALIIAHGGNIWVRSKEGEGAIFSFTLLPYDQISDEAGNGEDGIIRGAHGWIKNHSLYRN